MMGNWEKYILFAYSEFFSKLKKNQPQNKISLFWNFDNMK